MIRQLDHVGVAVEEVDDALGFYVDLLGFGKTHDEVFDGMRVVFVAPETDGTGAEFELLEPLDGGAVADYIERRGEGVQHVAFEVNGIESELERLDDAGVRLIDDEPRDGARGKRVAFVHPSETNGVLLELCEK